MSRQHDVLTETAVEEAGPLGEPAPLQLPPLTVSALMVTKADLLAALRVYIPQLVDLEMIDGDRFLLTVGADPSLNGAPQ